MPHPRIKTLPPYGRNNHASCPWLSLLLTIFECIRSLGTPIVIKKKPSFNFVYQIADMILLDHSIPLLNRRLLCAKSLPPIAMTFTAPTETLSLLRNTTVYIAYSCADSTSLAQCRIAQLDICLAHVPTAALQFPRELPLRVGMTARGGRICKFGRFS